MSDISIDDFLDSIPDVEGIDKYELKKKFNSIENPEEQLRFMQKLHDQAKARYEDLKARKSKEERAARTRRLVELGALVESILGTEVDHDYVYALLNTIKNSYYGNINVYKAIGAAAEQKLNRSLVKEDLQRFINFIDYQERAGSYFSKAMNRGYDPNNQ